MASQNDNKNSNLSECTHPMFNDTNNRINTNELEPNNFLNQFMIKYSYMIWLNNLKLLLYLNSDESRRLKNAQVLKNNNFHLSNNFNTGPTIINNFYLNGNLNFNIPQNSLVLEHPPCSFNTIQENSTNFSNFGGRSDNTVQNITCNFNKKSKKSQKKFQSDKCLSKII